MSLGAIGYEAIWVVVFGVVAHRSYRGVWLVPSIMVADDGLLC